MSYETGAAACFKLGRHVWRLGGPWGRCSRCGAWKAAPAGNDVDREARHDWLDHARELRGDARPGPREYEDVEAD